MRILLVVPHQQVKYKPSIDLPLGVLSMASYLRTHSNYTNVEIYDANLSGKLWTDGEGRQFLGDRPEEIQKRLLQELEEMSGTCSSGFASRLVNVFSGFGSFGIRISWEDQVKANFMGRLNAVARQITDDDSIFRKEPYLTNLFMLFIVLRLNK